MKKTFSDGRAMYEIAGRRSGLTPAMADLIHRRTAPFLDFFSVSTCSVHQLMKEAYLQGINDAVDAMHHKEESAT